MKSYRFIHSTSALAGLTLAGLLALLPALTGCVSTTTTAGGGVATYTFRDLESTVGQDYNKVVEAARQALKQLEFTKVSDTKDAYAALLVARSALDKKIMVTVINSGKNLTSIKIRVGVIGDQPLSLAILEKIRADL